MDWTGLEFSRELAGPLSGPNYLVARAAAIRPC